MKAIVLAGGKGKRLHSAESDMPKVLRELDGKPLIHYALKALDFLKPEDICIVVGFQGEKVRECLGETYIYAVQKEQLGTGHAVMAAQETFNGYEGDVMILYGDMPLITRETLKAMIDVHQREKAAATLLTGLVYQNPPAYGRIIRDNRGQFTKVVELKDCTPAQAAIPELNIGPNVYHSPKLFGALQELKNENVQKEYLLTDVSGILLSKGEKVITYTTENDKEIHGVNTPEDLERCVQLLTDGV